MIAPDCSHVAYSTVPVDGVRKKSKNKRVKKSNAQYFLFRAPGRNKDLPEMDHLTYFERDVLDVLYTILRAQDADIQDKSIPPAPAVIPLSDIAAALGLQEVYGPVGPMGLHNARGYGNRTNYRIQVALMQLIGTIIYIDATEQAKNWDLDITADKYAASMLSGAQVLLRRWLPITQADGTEVIRNQQQVIIPAARDVDTGAYSYVGALPLYRYAEDMGGHIAMMAGDWYRLPGQATEDAQKLNAYLRHIILIACKTGDNPKIIYDSTIRQRIWDNADVSRQTWYKRRKMVEKQLDLWVAQGQIMGYKYIPSSSKTLNDAKWSIQIS